MSSGCTRCSVCVAPVPFGWKLCFMVSPKMSCLTVNVLGEALVLGALELELEHPAIPSRPAATTVAPSQVAVRRLKMFTKALYAIRVTCGAAESKAQVNGTWRKEGQLLKASSTLVNAQLGSRRAAYLRAWFTRLTADLTATTGTTPVASRGGRDLTVSLRQRSSEP